MTIKKKRISIKEGDVFTIPIDAETQGYGQIVKIPSKYDFIMIVFEGKWPLKQEVQLSQLVKRNILFFGFTTDTLLNLGRWNIIGNITSNLSCIIMPYYKVGFSPETKLINYKVEVIRMATSEEDKLLPFHSSMSPMGYQKELQAYYGVIKWEADMIYNYQHMVNTLTQLNLLLN